METIEKSRLEARVTPQQKKLFVRAAAVAGMSLSDFVKNALVEKAYKTLRDHDVIELCLADQEKLAFHLLTPPEAPADFRDLAEWRRRQDQDA
ncbi:MAG: DUF1778 domain-containing protein [Candidatus Omnitrophica bacterium]|nr:DUF1778 domain-containing protein [Candidatus Omnitrophota bacterium]